MIPITSLSRLLRPSRTQLCTLMNRSLKTAEGRLKQCGSGGGGSKRHDPADICKDSQPCKSAKKKKKGKMCDMMRQHEAEDSKCQDAANSPEMCSRQAMLDCARKLEELQKKWESMARTAERVEEAMAAKAGAGKRASGCPVKPPAKPEKEGSSMPIILTVMAVIAGIAYYLYTQSEEGGEGGDGEDKEKKEE